MNLSVVINIILLLKQCQGEYDNEFANYKGCQLISATPKTQTEFNYLLQLYKSNVKGLEFWRRPIGINKVVSLQLCPNANVEVVNKLKQMKYVTKIKDIQKNIDDETTTYKHLRHFDASALALDDFKIDEYHSLEEIKQLIRMIKKTFPEMIDVETIGITSENNKLKLIKLSKRSKNPGIKKKGFWLDSGTHAREWVTIASVIFVIKELLTSKEKDVQSMLDKFDFYILLVANPDGYEFTWSTHRMWRKNRSNDSESACLGVDINRNYNIAFNGTDEGKEAFDGCSDIYRGAKPFSEKETQSIRDYLLKLKDNLQVYISVHAFSQMWLLPYGYKKEKPKDYDELISMAKKMMKAMEEMYGTQYTAGTIQELLYPTCGSSLDWVYDVLKVKYAYSVELRDDGEYGFLLPRSQIIPTGQELFAAIQVLAKGFHENNE